MPSPQTYTALQRVQGAGYEAQAAELERVLAEHAETVCGPYVAEVTRLGLALTDQTQRADLAEAAVITANATIADLRAQLEQYGPGMLFGVSATPGRFIDGYAHQRDALGARACYYYGKPGEAVYWGDSLASVPDDHDIWLQVKDVTRLDLSGFPTTRRGRVYLHFWNEPENNVEKGDFTLAQWQANTDALYAKIGQARAGGQRQYLVRAVELMHWTLQLTEKGTANTARQVASYLRPGVEHVGWSAYAEKKVKGGHEVASIDPANMPERLARFAESSGLPFSVAATGWAIDTAHLSDQVSLDNRRAWLAEVAPNLAAAGARHLMWFSIPWGNGSYVIEDDPGLLAVWNELRTAALTHA